MSLETRNGPVPLNEETLPESDALGGAVTVKRPKIVLEPVPPGVPFASVTRTP